MHHGGRKNVIAHDRGEEKRAGGGVERVQRDRRGVLGVSPGRREFRPMRHEQHHRQPRDPVDEHRQEVERRGVRPMRVLDQDQDRHVAGHARQPPRQHAVDAPRAGRGVQIGARYGLDPKQIVEKDRVLGEQRRRRRDQRVDPRAPRLGRKAPRKAGPRLDMAHDRMQRPIGQVSRAVPFHDAGGFAAETLDERQRQARLADARLAAEMRDLSAAGPHRAPASKERIELLLATDKRIEAGHRASVEPALRRAFAEQTIDRDRLGKALEDDVAPLLVFEHRPAKSSRGFRDDDFAGPRDALQPGRKIERLADDRLLQRDPLALDSPTTTTSPVAMPTRTLSGSPSGVRS